MGDVSTGDSVGRIRIGDVSTGDSVAERTRDLQSVLESGGVGRDSHPDSCKHSQRLPPNWREGVCVGARKRGRDEEEREEEECRRTACGCFA
eukprot:2604387-Rhodomonas_salina.2